MTLSHYSVAPVEQSVKAAVYSVESDLEVARHSVGSDLLQTEHPFSASPDSTCHRMLSKFRNSDSVDTPSKSGRSICCWVVQLPVAVLAAAEDSVVFVALDSAVPVVDPEIARHSVVVQLSVVATVPVHLLPH